MSGLYRVELARLVRTSRVRWLSTMVTLMIATSFLIAWSDARRAVAEATVVQARERARWLAQDPKNPHSAAHYGQWLFKRRSPLAVLDPGVDPYVGRMMRAEAHHYNDAVFREAQDKGPLARAGTGTVADVLHVVLPLIAMLLGFSAFAVDRERGTLRLALGNGAAPGRLLAARSGALMTVLAASVAVPVLVLGVGAATTLDGEGWQPIGRLLLWTTAELGYLAIFLAVALVASLLATTARSALAASLLAWALFCVVTPRLVTVGVEAFAPTPSQQETQASIEKELRRFNDGEANARRQTALLARYGAGHAAALPVNLAGTLGHEREQHDYAVYDRGLSTFNAALLRQDGTAAVAGLLSPMVAVQSVSQALAGTDYRRHVAFLNEAERYRRLLVDTMNLDLAAHPGEYEAGRTLWERVPPYASTAVPLSRSLLDAAVPLAILAGWIVATVTAAWLAARRVKP